MSYDLRLTGPTGAATDVERRVRRVKPSLADVLASTDGEQATITASMPRSDAEVAKAYRALVKAAAANGWTVHDPQRGEDVDLDAPGRYPPGWLPTRPPSGKSTKARIKQLVTEDLRAAGFVLRDPKTAVRPREGFEEKLVFQAGRGRITVNVCRFFPTPLAEPYEMHGNQRVGQLIAGEDRWYPDDTKGFGQLRGDIREHVLPWLDAHATLESIVAAVERGTLLPLGADPGWARYTLAHVYRTLGRSDDALNELLAVVRDHAKCNHRLHLEKLLTEDAPQAWIDTATKTLEAYEGGPEDWVHRRTEAAKAEIAELESRDR